MVFGSFPSKLWYKNKSIGNKKKMGAFHRKKWFKYYYAKSSAQNTVVLYITMGLVSSLLVLFPSVVYFRSDDLDNENFDCLDIGWKEDGNRNDYVSIAEMLIATMYYTNCLFSREREKRRRRRLIISLSKMMCVWHAAAIQRLCTKASTLTTSGSIVKKW